MSELIRALRHFIGRDMIYIIGGSWIIASFSYAFGCTTLPDMDYAIAVYLLLLGTAYLVGHATQELFHLLHLVSTQIPPTTNRFTRWLYRRFTGKEWKTPSPLGYLQTVAKLEERYKLDGLAMAELHHIVTLKHAGTATGPCAIVSSCPLFLRVLRTGHAMDWSLAVGALLIGILMACLGWIKGMQQAQYLHELLQDPSQVPGHGTPFAPQDTSCS